MFGIRIGSGSDQDLENLDPLISALQSYTLIRFLGIRDFPVSVEFASNNLSLSADFSLSVSSTQIYSTGTWLQLRRVHFL